MFPMEKLCYEVNASCLKIVAKSRQQLASPTSPRSREWDRPTRWFEYLTSEMNFPVTSSCWKPVEPDSGYANPVSHVCSE
ncbi:hypothetical protein IFM89_018716 [Coptis chinensis]|uniref:Uncharacterized protein n=1 Tax=Coptis chinensis TaxID=261450 RepID=A0A835M5C0_9MAGN|nr:hypothetical protein IFM89_018716 [Coptis chinensis]